MKESFKQVMKYLPPNLKTLLNSIPIEIAQDLEEIRLRIGQPFIIYGGLDEYFILKDGDLSKDSEGSYIVTERDLKNTINLLCNYSFYSYEEEIKSGYITIEGGHRVGLCGECIVFDGKIRDMKNIFFINIRIAHEIIGASGAVLPFLIHGGEGIFNTLIISPPRCGKTTLLRDIGRQLSNGINSLGFKGGNVCIIDERSELAASIKGKPSNDVGMRTDVFDRLIKADGIMLAIRSMSPRAIIVDEIGRPEDARAIEDASNAGIAIITSIHGNGLEDFKQRATFNGIKNDVFDRYVIISRKKGPGTIDRVLDRDGNELSLC